MTARRKHWWKIIYTTDEGRTQDYTYQGVKGPYEEDGFLKTGNVSINLERVHDVKIVDEGPVTI